MPRRTYILVVLLSIPGICSAQTISPGTWQISLQSQSEAVSLPPMQVSQCLTDADARDPAKLLGGISNPGASGCTYSDKSYSGNTFSFAMECAGIFGIKANGSVSFTSTTMSGTINTTANINGQPVAMKNVIAAQRTGDCDRF